MNISTYTLDMIKMQMGNLSPSLSSQNVLIVEVRFSFQLNIVYRISCQICVRTNMCEMCCVLRDKKHRCWQQTNSLFLPKDIVETGRTMETLLKLLNECHPKMVKVVRWGINISEVQNKRIVVQYLYFRCVYSVHVTFKAPTKEEL